MATQRCPKCGSKRVRQGYRPTSTLLKLIFRYHLLCDECNWEFTGFAIPGTIRKRTRRKKANNNVETGNNHEVIEDEDNLISEILSNGQKIKNVPKSNKKGKKAKEVSLKQPALFENEAKKLTEAKIDSTDVPLKKQKVRKKVRVKFY